MTKLAMALDAALVSPIVAVAVAVLGAHSLLRAVALTRARGREATRWRDRLPVVVQILFHWSVVLLCALFLLGGAMYSEGVVNVLVGDAATDAPAGYTTMSNSPEFGSPFSGRLIAVEGVYRADAWSLEETIVQVVVSEPQRVLNRGDLTVGERLGVGQMSVRLLNTGVAAIYSVESSQGVQVGRIPFLLGSDPGDAALERRVRGETGLPLTAVRMSASSEGAAAETSVTPAAVSVVATAPVPGSVYGSAHELRLGQGIELPEGHLLRYVSSEEWASLAVVHNPIAPWLVYSAVFTGLCLLALVVIRLGGRLTLRAGTRREVEDHDWEIER